MCPCSYSFFDFILVWCHNDKSQFKFEIYLSNYIYISGGKVGGVTEDLGGTGPQDYGINVNGNDHDHIRIIGVDVTDNQESVGILWTTSGGNVDAASDNFIQFCPGYSAGQTSFP